jgi:hypothetical protein
MLGFDLDEYIEEVKSDKYTKSYTNWAVSLLKEVGRM